MKTVPLADLPTTFRERAAFLREYAAAEQAATAWERAAIEVEAALRVRELDALTLRDASSECGYSVEHLRRLLRDATIPNSGSSGRPLILRSHLPRKPGHGIALRGSEEPSSITQVARAIATRGETDGST